MGAAPFFGQVALFDASTTESEAAIITRRKDRVKTGVTPLAAMLTVMLSTVVFLLWLGLVVIVTKVVMG